MNLVILTIKTPGNMFLANRLSDEFNVVGMVVLSGRAKTIREKFTFWSSQSIRYGVFRTLNRFLYVKLSARKNDCEAIEKAYFYPDTSEIGYEFDKNILETQDINSDAVARFIRGLSPELIAVCGSSVLKPKIFTVPFKGTINIHCGITPAYRSAHPVEWAIYNRDFDNVGVTIHFVDEGIDTGNTIYQRNIGVEKGDTISSLYAKNIVQGTELMVKAIKAIADGSVTSIPQTKNAGRHYLAIEYGYLQHRKVNKILRSL